MDQKDKPADDVASETPPPADTENFWPSTLQPTPPGAEMDYSSGTDTLPNGVQIIHRA